MERSEGAKRPSLGDEPYTREPPARNQGATDCRCGAHRQHKVFQFMWNNPSARRRDAARALKISESNVWSAIHRLRKRDLSRRCPECFRPNLFNGVCENCGFEPFVPSIPENVKMDSQSPTNFIHAGNLLGSKVAYSELGLTNHELVLKRRLERGIEDSLIRNVKSDVENELKRTYPNEAITDEAGRLVVKEILEFRRKYPALRRPRI